MARRGIDIERLLRWAYRSELTKMPAHSGALASSFGTVMELGTKIQGMSGGSTFYECVLDEGTPHEDALSIHRAVLMLDSADPQTGRPFLRQEWDIEVSELLADMPSHVAGPEAREAFDSYRARWPQRSSMVMRHARKDEASRDARPAWEAAPPELKPMLGKNGQPKRWVLAKTPLFHGRGVVTGHEERWADAYDPVGKRTHPEGVLRFQFDPPVSLVVDLRADYVQWHASLCWLVGELGPKLAAWEPTGPEAPAMPWLTGEGHKARVLPALDLSAV